MTKTNHTTNHAKGEQLNYEIRCVLEKYFEEGKSNRYCAKQLHASPSTITNERHRGMEPYIIHSSGEVKFRAYKANYAQERYEALRSCCHKTTYFEKQPEFKKRVLELLIPCPKQKRISIEVALFLLKEEFDELPSFKTVYNAINKGQLGKQVMAFMGRYKKAKKAEIHDYKRHLGKAITERPEEVESRETFGHWEIDLVLGKREKGEVLLTMLERKSNHFIVRKCKDKLATTINQEVKQIFKDYGKVNFKTITSDNGSEFSELHKLRQVEVYFCHPFSSWEKGGIERHNRMLREFIKKGTRIEDYSYFDIVHAQHMINDYPRKSFQFQTPYNLFNHFCI